MDKKIATYWYQIEDIVVRYIGSVLLAAAVLIIGWWLINKFTKAFSKWMEKKEVDLSLRPFLRSIIKFSLRIMLIIAVAGMVGIKTTSFVAVLGAAGLAIGLALQGSLANFAGGVIILLLKPFKAGEFIQTGDMMGTVREIHVFYTYITSIHNQELVIPNGQLANAAITNYSRYDSRRMDMPFRVAYDADIDKAKAILDELISAEGALLKDPPHSIFVEELTEHYVKINVRAWLKADEFWDVCNSLSEKVKKRFDREGIRIPYPTMDVRMANKG